MIPRSRSPDYNDHARSDFKTQLPEAKEESHEVWRESRDAIIERLAIQLHKLSTRIYLIIADQEAFGS
jgi:hypothetical protein